MDTRESSSEKRRERNRAMNRTESAMNETNETLAEEGASTPAGTDRRAGRRGMLRAALKVAAVGAAGLASAELVGTHTASAATTDKNFYAGNGTGIAYNMGPSYEHGIACYGSISGVEAHSTNGSA